MTKEFTNLSNYIRDRIMEEDKGKYMIPEDKVKKFIKREDYDISELLSFLQSDMWYSFNNEIKTEDELMKYLEDHFNILNKKRKKLAGKQLIK